MALSFFLSSSSCRHAKQQMGAFGQERSVHVLFWHHNNDLTPKYLALWKIQTGEEFELAGAFFIALLLGSTFSDASLINSCDKSVLRPLASSPLCHESSACMMSTKSLYHGK